MPVQNEYPKVKCNFKINALKTIREYITQPHGASLVGVSMVDPRNKGIKMVITFDNEFERQVFLDTLVARWCIYKPIPASIRSWSINNKFLSEFMSGDVSGKLSSETKRPEISGFGNAKALIDINEDSVEKTAITVWWLAETWARTLKLKLKEPPKDMVPMIIEAENDPMDIEAENVSTKID